MRELQSGYVIFQAFLCHNTHQKRGGGERGSELPLPTEYFFLPAHLNRGMFSPSHRICISSEGKAA